MLLEIGKKQHTFLQVLGLCLFPNIRYSSKCFAQIYRVQVGGAMLAWSSLLHQPMAAEK